MAEPKRAHKGNLMIVGCCTLLLAIPHARSLKAKRKVVRSLIDRIRHKFKVSIAEVEQLDRPERAVLGVAVVSNDGRHANSVLDAVVAMVETDRGAVLLRRSMELVHLEPAEDLGHADLMIGLDSDLLGD